MGTRRADNLPETEPDFRAWALRKLRQVQRATKPGDPLESRERSGFLRHYFGTLMLEGPVLEHRVAAIRRLVEMQMPGSTTPRLEVRLHGSVNHFSMDLRIEKLSDIDFADLHGILEVHTVEVLKLDEVPWTDVEIAAALEHVRWDMGEDGVITDLHADVYTDGDGNDEVLVIRGEWDVDEADDDE